MDRDWIFSEDGFTCGLRAAGVLVRDGMILVQRERGGSEYALPGGHVKVGETLEGGLSREMAEELGIKIKCERLLWTEEAFWEWGGRLAHTVAFYFRVWLCGGEDIPENGGFVPQKDNSEVELGWLPVDELQNVSIYPAFLKEEINRLDGPAKHFISRDN